MPLDTVEKYRNAFKKIRDRNTELEKALGESIGVIEEFEKNAPDLEKMSAELEGLYGTIREGTHRAAFDEAADAANVDPAMRDDVWELLKLDTSKDEPDAKAIGKALEEFLKDRPKLVTEPAGEARDGDGDGDEDQADGGDNDKADDKAAIAANNGAFKSIFDLAPKNKTKNNAGAKAGETPAGKPGTAPAAGKLTKGEGTARGGRDDHKISTVEQQINEEFAATGRTDPFRIA